MSFLYITITRECRREGQLREVQGIMYTTKLGGCLFFLRKRKDYLVFDLYISQMGGAGPPLKVQRFPLYIERDYIDRKMILWLGYQAESLIGLSRNGT